jgi:hypothetical protein
MKKYSYNYGRPVEKIVVPTLAQTMNLFDKLRRSGKLFRVDFKKRGDGSIRTMICRFGVKSHLKGGSRPFDFGDKGLLSVYEPGTGYRSIPIDNIYCVKFAGVVYILESLGMLDVGTYDTTMFSDLNHSRTLRAQTSPMY